MVGEGEACGFQAVMIVTWSVAAQASREADGIGEWRRLESDIGTFSS
jgi:hypothetical protein